MEEKPPELPGFDIRYTTQDDAKYLLEWLSDPMTLRYFPMREPAEIEDSVNRWIGFSRFKSSITAMVDGEPVGLATLYLQAYRTLAHQCEFGLIVSPKYRGKGIGTHLMRNILHLAKSYFNIEVLHLQVHGENPAINMYKKFGFSEFGRQTRWGKDGGTFLTRVLMERYL